jgi:hypothetical protein
MKRVALCLGAVFLLALLLVGWLRFTAAPILDYSTNRTKEPTPGPALTVDARVQRAVTRAKLDFFVYPIPDMGRGLYLMGAQACPPDDIYLRFSAAADSHSWVAYRCVGKDGHPLWKAAINDSP